MEILSFLKDLSLNEISFVHTYIDPVEKYPFRNKGRGHHGFLFTIDGTEKYTFSDREIHAVPGSVLYIPKDEAYTIQLDDEKSVVITIDFEINNPTPVRPFCVKFSNTSEIKRVFEETEKLWLKKTPEFIPMLKSNVYKIAALMIRRESTYSNSKNFERIRTAVEYLHASFLENSFRIERMFEIAGISPRYFETLFFNEFNMTPKEYITALKLSHAKELLKSEKFSVGDIASALGYSDVYHFSKMFKKKTGYSPTEYKTLYRNSFGH